MWVQKKLQILFFIKFRELEKGYIINEFTQGKPGNIFALLLVGINLDYDVINKLVLRAEENVSFKIRYIAVSPNEAKQYFLDKSKSILGWSVGLMLEESHQINDKRNF